MLYAMSSPVVLCAHYVLWRVVCLKREQCGGAVAFSFWSMDPPALRPNHHGVHSLHDAPAQAPALPTRSWAGFASARRVGSAWSRSWLRWAHCSRMPAQACLRHRCATSG